MSNNVTKTSVSIFVFAFSLAYLCHHLAARSHVDVSRDAVMFGSQEDSTRNISVRTDFASFYYACKAVTQAGNMYDAKHLDSLAASDGVANHVLPYLYPPFFAIMAHPLGSLAPLAAQNIWDYAQVLSLSLIAVIVLLIAIQNTDSKTSPWLVAGITCVAVVVLPFTININFGQINFLVLLFLSLSFFFHFTQRSDLVAGLFLSLAVLIKVTPAFLLIYFLVNRRWKVISGFFLGMVVFTLATFYAAGNESWQQFTAFLPNMGYVRNVEGGFHPSIVANFSLAGFFMRVFPGEANLVRILTMSSVVVLFGVLLYNQLKHRHERNEAAFILPYLVLMVIASPVTWLHHLIFLFPGIMFALNGLWFEVRDLNRVAPLLLMSLLVVLAMINYQAIHRLLTIPEGVRPFVTSMNLVFLVLLFILSLAISKKTLR